MLWRILGVTRVLGVRCIVGVRRMNNGRVVLMRGSLADRLSSALPLLVVVCL